MSRTSAPGSSCDATPAGPHITPNAAKAEPAKLRPVTDLHCYICTPTPSFTNTSHLLTHLASKSHLRALFEIELCATQCGDEGCARALEKFHTWYYAENVGEHLVDRFIIKKGKWSREKLKPEAEEPLQEGQENIMVNGAQVLRQQEGENVMVKDTQALRQPKEEFSDRGLAEILIAAMNEDKKRKREDLSTPTLPASRLNVGILTLPCMAKGGTARSAGGRKPLASLVNEAPVKATQPPVEEQLTSSYTNTLSGESGLSQVKVEEARLSVSNPSPENEEETDINEGPDRGVIYSPRGPRLRGKVWPGMAVFDGAPSLNFMRTTPSRVFSPSGVSPFAIPVKEEKSPTSGLLNEAPSCPGALYTQGSKPGTILEPASCNSETSAKRLKHTDTPLEVIFQGVGEIDDEIDNDSDLDADAEYEIEEDLEYILREDPAKTDGNQQLKLFHQTAASNTTFPPSQVHGQVSFLRTITGSVRLIYAPPFRHQWMLRSRVHKA